MARFNGVCMVMVVSLRHCSFEKDFPGAVRRGLTETHRLPVHVLRSATGLMRAGGLVPLLNKRMRTRTNTGTFCVFCSFLFLSSLQNYSLAKRCQNGPKPARRVAQKRRFLSQHFSSNSLSHNLRFWHLSSISFQLLEISTKSDQQALYPPVVLAW